jgi:hypothetical protein
MARETMVALPVTIKVNVTGRVRQCRPDLEQHCSGSRRRPSATPSSTDTPYEVVVELDYRGKSRP